MITASFFDLISAVDLFGQHHAGQMVREGHFRHAQAQLGALLHPLAQAVGAADDKAELRLSRVFSAGDQLRHPLAWHLPALDAEGDQIRVARDGLQDLVRLPFERGADLRLGGVVGQALLGDVRTFQAAIRAEALAVLLEGLDIEARSLPTQISFTCNKALSFPPAP